MSTPRDIREFNRREFIKTISIGLSALPAVGLGIGTLQLTGCGGSVTPPQPPPLPQTVRWPIASSVYTTAQQQVLPVAVPATALQINPGDVAQYAPNGYSTWKLGGPLSWIVRKDLAPGYTGAPNVARLLYYYAMSDIHIADKESPAQPIYVGLHAGYGSQMSSAYSPIILSTPQVLDAAVQTINALHEMRPFDFGLSLGDACNNTQYNELRWFLDTLDGKVITPSSGVHLGAATIDYQQPFYAAGLNPTISWYQVIGNHDQFWMGSQFDDFKTRNARIAGTIIDMETIPSSPTSIADTGYYMGVVNGLMPYGDIYGAGPEGDFQNPPPVAADGNRRSLSSDSSTTRAWMQEFFNTTSSSPLATGSLSRTWTKTLPATVSCPSPTYPSSSLCWMTQ